MEGNGQQQDIDAFPKFHNFVKETTDLKSAVAPIVMNHLENVRKRLLQYFSAILNGTNTYQWLVSPFAISSEDVRNASLPLLVAEQLLDISTDISLKAVFPMVPLPVFWSELLPKYPVVAMYAVKLLLPFASTWSCEAGFSAMTAIKCKSRNRLHAENDLRLALTKNISPRIDLLCSKLQCHPSH